MENDSRRIGHGRFYPSPELCHYSMVSGILVFVLIFSMNKIIQSSDKMPGLVDCDANLLHMDLKDSIDHHISTANFEGVSHFLVPGATLEESRKALELCSQREAENKHDILATAGVHPYHVNEVACTDESLAILREMALRDECIAVGKSFYIIEAAIPKSLT